MTSVIISSFFILWCSTAYGQFIKEKFELSNLNYTAPLGFAGLLLTLQVFYYPIQYFNLNSRFLMWITLVILLLIVLMSMLRISQIIKQYMRLQALWVIIAFALFIFLFYQSSIFMMYADTQMYLNYIAQNVNTSRVNDFLLWTGLQGVEFDAIYLFQGYFHFISSIIQILNMGKAMFGLAPVDNIVISTWGLGLVYSVVSSLTILEFINYFKYKSQWIKSLLTIFSLFYTNLLYWKLSYSFYGNTWRSLFMATLMFILFKWIQEERDEYKYIGAIIFGASLAASSSSLFIGFATILGFTYYRFKTKAGNIIADISILSLPMVVYVLAILAKDHLNIAIILLVISLLYFSRFIFQVVNKVLLSIEGFVKQHTNLIFIIFLPLVAIIYSFVYKYFNPSYPYDFFHYFQNHAGYDMVKDYLFIHSDIFDIFLNILRWSAVALLIYKYRVHKSSNYILSHFLLTALFFLNPLTTVFISKTFASNVYYRAFESIFNAFSEVLLFSYLFNYLWNKKFIFWFISLLLMLTVSYQHYASYILNDRTAIYGLAMAEGKTVMPIYKISYNEYDIIQNFIALNNDKPIKNKQLTVVSHANGLRTFVPDAYQLFTARQYWYNWDRVNQEFYELAWRKFPWDEVKILDYPKSCDYLSEFSVDYIIVETIYNKEFDKATDSCTFTYYSNGEYKIKKVN